MKTVYNKITGKVLFASIEAEETDELGVTELVCNDSFIEAHFDFVNQKFYEGTSLTLAEIQALEVDNQIKKEFEAYEKRCFDGRMAYNMINAEFRVMKENGMIEQSFYDLISETLIPVRNEVLAGQWITALSKLETIGNPLIGIDLYNRLHLQIYNYISENY